MAAIPLQEDLFDALRNLHEQLEQAQQVLRKMPGATAVHVELDPYDPDELPLLAVYCQNGLGVVHQEIGSFRHFNEISVDARVRLAEAVPELLDRAQANQAGYAEVVNEAANNIQLRLAMLQDGV